ncbi:nuclear cap-binding protein subunit 2-like [Urocitellus parryii]|uniref:nuclear cap-binding protein subunit 2-like n=1 Tax=Urocitellus parryii TaxID=9999 RepID=UPI000E55C5DD|nr:nuclear cap-binding protein subunit 2-like [Urocitellus parryii]
MSSDLRFLNNVSFLELSDYQDQQFSVDNVEYEKLLKENSTLYVGNLSFHTEPIYELFNGYNDIKNVFMGLGKVYLWDWVELDRYGFCFVQYHNRADVENAMQFLNGTCLNDHIIGTDWDLSYLEGRQCSKGQSGGQVIDDFLEDFDVGFSGHSCQGRKHVNASQEEGLGELGVAVAVEGWRILLAARRRQQLSGGSEGEGEGGRRPRAVVAAAAKAARELAPEPEPACCGGRRAPSALERA